MLPAIILGFSALVAAKAVHETFFENDHTDYESTITSVKLGAPVYTKFVGGVIEHSGVCVGLDKILSLQGDGKIIVQSPKEFASGSLTGLSSKIYIADIPSHDFDTVNRAMDEANRFKYNYSLTSNNCHMFTIGSMTGDFGNKYGNQFKVVEEITQARHGPVTWVRWDY